jgi:arginyl-tRNA synthetase
MLAAPTLKKSPMEIAEDVQKNIVDREGYLEKTEIAKPGFINLFFKDEWYFEVLRRIEKLDKKFGEIDAGAGQKVLLEYVSANPVGPLHIGHGRWAAVGDSLARTLRKAGFNVHTEFYVNNYGRQMNLFFASVEAAYGNLFGEKTELPEDGYKGSYIKDIACYLKDKYNVPPEKIDANFIVILRDKSFDLMLDSIKKSLEKMDVKFNFYFKEKEKLHDRNDVKKLLDLLEKNGQIYKKDGALWLNTSQYGDEKDRVVQRSNGEYTYFAADIAYHDNKLDRGFDKLINIWGADHHGYIARVKAAIAALGEDPSKLEVILGQLVNLFRDGKLVKMSKRTGELITLDELIEEVGVDAIRFTFLTKSTDTPLDFDINLVKEQSDKNPVFYVQYAHARISSIIRFAAEKGVVYKGAKDADFNLLKENAEIDLIKTLEEFEEIVEIVSKNLTPHLLTTYAQKLATAFHSFYTVSRVITDDEKLTQARLGLLNCTHITLRNVLELLGVSAPDKM